MQLLGMKKILKAIGLILLAVVMLFIGLFVIPYFGNIVMPWNRTAAIEAALEWGGLPALPKGSKIVSVDTEGGMSSREFIIEFECDKESLDAWIKQSGLHKLTPVKEENGIKVYRVEGQKGSIGGYVYIDENKGNVVIDMSWS